MSKELIAKHLQQHRKALDLVGTVLVEPLAVAAEMIGAALDAGGKLLLIGNGGSAADAQHFAAELVGRFLRERRALPAVALTTDSSILTAVGNDYGFEEVFSRQVAALARPGDLVFGISTSGNSANVQRGLAAARDRGCQTIALLGRDGGRIAAGVDLALTVAVAETPAIQEAHGTMIHILCDLIETRLCAGPAGERP